MAVWSLFSRENRLTAVLTDTDYTGDSGTSKVTQEDVDYLLGIVNNRFPEANITIDDIEAAGQVFVH